MYDVCIRKNRHGDWVAVIKWTVWDRDRRGQPVQKQMRWETLPYTELEPLLFIVQALIEKQEKPKSTSKSLVASAELLELLEKTKDHKMTAEEKRAQAISFAYGNCKLSNENITREQVERAYDKLHADDDFVGKD